MRAWPSLVAIPQPYPDLVVGFIAATDYPKSAEYRAAAGFFLLFALAWPIVTTVVNRVPVRMPIQPPTTWSMTPHGLLLGIAAYSATYALLTRSWPWLPLGAWLILLTIWRALTRPSSSSHDAPRVFAVLMIFLICTYFSILGLFAVLAAVRPEWFAGRESECATAALIGLEFSAVALIMAHRAITVDGWRTIAFSSQALLPLLVTVLAHDAYRHHGVIAHLNMPFATRAGVLTAALAGCASQILAWRRSAPWREIPSADRIIRPASVVWIAAFLAYRVPEYSGFEWDSLHLGELLLPWHQAVTHDLRLFEDFVPVQGGMSLVYGMVNGLLLDGTISSFPIAISWMSVIAAALAAWAVCMLAGPAWGLILAPFLPIGYTSIMVTYNRLFLMLPMVAVLAHPALVAKPRRWLAVWAVLSIVALLYNVIIGSACVAASVVIAGWMAWRAYRSAIAVGAHGPAITRIAAWIPGLALGIGVLPFLAGQVRFVMENAASNTTAYGYGALQSGPMPDWFWWPSKLAWESIRTGGWVMGVIALFAVFVYGLVRRRYSSPTDAAALVFPAMSVLFLISLIPYSLGQVWPDEMSRSGAASMLAIGSLVPVALILSAGRDARVAIVAAGLIGALLGLRGAFGQPDPWLLAQRAMAAIDAPDQTIRWHGDPALPHMGSGFILPTKLDATRSLDAAMRQVLRDNETYLDLTNRPAFYVALNRRAPAPYVADYNAPNHAIQRRIIAALEREAPPLAWIGPRSSVFTASLRAYRVYRWLIERGYRYVRMNGYEFLVRPDRAEELGLPPESAEDRAALRRLVTPDDLGLIPAAWGRTLQDRPERFRSRSAAFTVASVDSSIPQDDPLRAWTLDQPIRGTDADFLALRVTCGRSLHEPFGARVFWSSTEDALGTDRPLTFRAVGGRLLIPLGIDPSWLRGRTITHLALRLDRDAIERCGVIHVDHPTLLRLID